PLLPTPRRPLGFRLRRPTCAPPPTTQNSELRTQNSLRRRRQLDLHAFVGFALGLGFDDLDPAYLEGGADVGAAIGLAIEADDVDHPDLCDPFGDEVDLGTDQIGILDGGIPGQIDDLRGVALDEFVVELALDFFPELGADRVEFEVHPGG